MNNYKRFVSYMYMYTNREKGENVGFAKVTVKDKIVNVNIGITGVMLENPQCQVYLVKGPNNVREHRGSCVLKSRSLAFNDTFIENEEVLGILILNDNQDIAFATIWTDADVDIFREGVEEFHEEVTVGEEEDYIEDLEAVSVEENQEELEVANVAAVDRENGLEEESEEVEVQQVEIIHVEIPEGPIKEPDMWECFQNYNEVDAFCDDYYFDLKEICPEDIDKLPQNLRILKKNSFMMHGYYNYKHLLLGRVRDSENRVFVGVPGTCHGSEKYMAGMFGFRNFKCSHRSDVKCQGFGYWYIEAPI